jgi:hypothetical protein
VVIWYISRLGKLYQEKIWQPCPEIAFRFDDGEKIGRETLRCRKNTFQLAPTAKRENSIFQLMKRIQEPF